MNSLIEMTNVRGSERARRSSEDPGTNGRLAPDSEVTERPQRRRFSAEYKLRIVREADACKGDGDVGALLRREGLYSSHLSSWRHQREVLAKAGMATSKRGRKAKVVDPHLKKLERENARLRRRLQRADIIIDIQKKASELLGIPLNSPDSDEND